LLVRTVLRRRLLSSDSDMMRMGMPRSVTVAGTAVDAGPEADMPNVSSGIVMMFTSVGPGIGDVAYVRVTAGSPFD